MKMTDGKGSCVGIEYQPLPAIKSEQLVPGTKVRLRSCSLRVGVLLLDPRCFEVRACPCLLACLSLSTGQRQVLVKKWPWWLERQCIPGHRLPDDSRAGRSSGGVGGSSFE